jgi:hypothetical protein
MLWTATASIVRSQYRVCLPDRVTVVLKRGGDASLSNQGLASTPRLSGAVILSGRHTRYWLRSLECVAPRCGAMI